MAILQQPQQPYNLFGPQMMEHQGKKAPQQTLPHTPAQQAAQQIANGNMSQIQQQAQQAEQRAMQTQAIPVTPNNGTPYQPQKQTKPITSTEELAAAMGYTSPEEENRLRKASVMNQRILAVGDALRHIGNIANTVGYAPSQQFNNPAMEEYARYEKSKAIRDAANARYYTYQQQKAAQDAKMRQWEYNMAKDARDYELKKSESEARNNLREAQLNRYQTMIALDEARREGIISDNEYKKRRAELYPEEVRSRIAKNNRSGGGRSGGSRGGGSNMPDYDVVTTYDRDDEGRVKSSRKTRTVKHANGTTSTNTKTTQPKKKALPGQTPVQPQKPAKKRLPGT